MELFKYSILYYHSQKKILMIKFLMPLFIKFLFFPPDLPGSTELLGAVEISSQRFSNRLLKDLVGILNIPLSH